MDIWNEYTLIELSENKILPKYQKHLLFILLYIHNVYTAGY